MEFQPSIFMIRGLGGMRQEYTLGSSPVNHRTHTPVTDVHGFGLWEETEGFGENPGRHGQNKVSCTQRSQSGLEDSFHEASVPTRPPDSERLPKLSFIGICGGAGGPIAPKNTGQQVGRSEGQGRPREAQRDLST